MLRRTGFTLIEILVVIFVIGMLAALVAPNVFSHVATARVETTRSQLSLLVAALDAYRLDNGAYPTTEQGLEALRRQPLRPPVPVNWRGPYLRKDVPLDAWGNAFEYRARVLDGVPTLELLSLGADGSAGGTGDAMDIPAL